MQSLAYLPRRKNRDKQHQPIVITDNMGRSIRVWPPAIGQKRLPGWFLNLISGIVKGGAA